MDPHEEYLSLQESALRCLYNGDVITFTNAQKAKEIFQVKGKPELIIVDSGIVFENDSNFLPIFFCR